jgi:molybdopterin-guanine dinucleotide biosynthesis protein A
VNNPVIVSIMIGGQSKRMGGGIKSLQEFNNKKIFDRILEKISPKIEKVIINCNSEEKKFTKYKLPIFNDLKEGYLGPLAGIHSAMKWIIDFSPEVKWLITLPGDTPFIPDDLVFQFKKKVSTNLKIILVKSNNKTHPAIGLWNTDLFNSLDKALDLGTRKILDWAQLHPLKYLNYEYEKYDPFFNINTEEDLKKAALIEKKFLNK